MITPPGSQLFGSQLCGQSSGRQLGGHGSSSGVGSVGSHTTMNWTQLCGHSGVTVSGTQLGGHSAGVGSPSPL